MFDLPAAQISTTDRATTGHGIGEIVATAGLVALIFLLARTGRHVLSAVAVGAYIGAAYWFTSSTSFSNPAVTIGRIFTDTFAGIAPGSVPLYIGAQILGAAIGLGVVVSLYPGHTAAAEHADHPPAATSTPDVPIAQEPMIVGPPGSPQRSEL
jgi:glycerol uptake facilitator-like aquaporin